MGWMMGIDEAGRGPVLGPMVYGCCFCDKSYLPELKKLGFADSKTLKQEEREALFETIKQDDNIQHKTIVLSSKRLSAEMLKRLGFPRLNRIYSF
jgi:ribonuclease H2 subunit A